MNLHGGLMRTESKGVLRGGRAGAATAKRGIRSNGPMFTTTTGFPRGPSLSGAAMNNNACRASIQIAPYDCMPGCSHKNVKN